MEGILWYASYDYGINLVSDEYLNVFYLFWRTVDFTMFCYVVSLFS